MAETETEITKQQSDQSIEMTWTPVAVIDVGASLIRMVIAEISSEGQIRTLENLSQPVSLGKDAFTNRTLKKTTIEKAVQIMQSYRKVMEEYQITQPEQIRAVATTAVRESVNQLAFLDRVYIATGIEINVLDEAEVNRITYLGVQPRIKQSSKLADAETIITEIGGGSTELLLVNGSDVLFSGNYRLGALRLTEMLKNEASSLRASRNLIQTQIRQTIDKISLEVSDPEATEMVALGGDMRFAAHQLVPDWDRKTLAQIPFKALSTFTEKILKMSEDKLVRKYHMTLDDAETVGSALLAYTEMARTLNLKNIYVSSLNLRDGLLHELTTESLWTLDFRQQVIRSAMTMAKKFDVDKKHGRHVARLSSDLFEGLTETHRLDERFELILHVAALLHEIGLFIGSRGYHKHTMYLIQHGTIFGLSEQDLLKIALVSRYHRRASPKSNHLGYSTLARDERIEVCKLAAILRVADALDQSYSQRIQNIRCQRAENCWEIVVSDVEDLSLEQMALKQKGGLFEEVYGLPIRLRSESH